MSTENSRLFTSRKHFVLCLFAALMVGVLLYLGNLSEVRAVPSVFYSLPGDGQAFRLTTKVGCIQANWDTVRGAVDGTVDWTSNNEVTLVSTSCSTGSTYEIARGFLAFDTSSIPDDAVITNASVKLYVHRKTNQLDDTHDFISIVHGLQASPQLLDRPDYSKAGDNILTPQELSGRVDIGNIVLNTYNNWDLNSAGLSQISKTGFTKLAIREGHDILNVPDYTAGQRNSIGAYLSENTNTSLRPYLEVTYTTGNGDTISPSISLTSPADSSTVSGSIVVSADASDNIGVVGVQFMVDGLNIGVEDTDATDGWTVTWDTNTVSNGIHALEAIARDAAGNTTTANLVSISVDNQVVDSEPPVVSITSPSDGSNVTGTINVITSATDNVGVAGVQFMLDGQNLGIEDTQSPFSVSWNTQAENSGNHSLMAVARDQAGNTASSLSINVNVTTSTPTTATNFVVIITDDQAYQTLDHMPYTNQYIVNEGIKFEKGFATTPLCCPSRASILTGQYVHNHLVKGNTSANILADGNTLATWLQSTGYRTSLIGKYLNGYKSTNFSQWPYVPPGWSDWRGIVDTNPPTYYDYTLNENGQLVTYGTGSTNYSTNVLADKAVQFIENTPPNQPLFLYFAPLAPHNPTTVLPEDSTKFLGYPDWRPPSYNEADVSDKPTWVRSLLLLSSSKSSAGDNKHIDHLQSLQAVDRAVGDIVSALVATGRLDNTVIIFASDHGYSWGEHRYLDQKQCVYEECIHIPLAIRVPGIAPRIDSTHIVANIDFAPTILELAGATSGLNMNGQSLVPLFNNPNAPWRNDILIESFTTTAGGPYFAVRTDTHIYVEYKNGERELYDLVNDPYQLTNVASDPANAGLISALQARLAQLKVQ